jgi:hypothetical protein
MSRIVCLTVLGSALQSSMGRYRPKPTYSDGHPALLYVTPKHGGCWMKRGGVGGGGEVFADHPS